MLRILLLLAATSANAAEPVSLLTPGQPFPPLKGEYLTGRKVELPSGTAGKVALLAIGFSYDSRWAVEAWSNRFRKEFARDSKVTWFEIPMIGGMGRMGKWFIDSGMRRGTPKELQENVITVYGGVDPWKKRLAFENARDAHLVLVDSQGVVRWIYRDTLVAGALNEAKFGELRAVVERLSTQVSGSPTRETRRSSTKPAKAAKLLTSRSHRLLGRISYRPNSPVLGARHFGLSCCLTRSPGSATINGCEY